MYRHHLKATNSSRGNNVRLESNSTENIFSQVRKMRRAPVNFAISVRLSAWNNSTLTERIFMKFPASLNGFS
jgi:hypothetical protein